MTISFQFYNYAPENIFSANFYWIENEIYLHQDVFNVLGVLFYYIFIISGFVKFIVLINDDFINVGYFINM